MKHATITIPDELCKHLEEYIASQGNRVELSTVVEIALREYLDRQDPLRDVEYRPFRITPADVGSGESDVSINHDAYFADDAYDDAFRMFREQS